MTNGGYVKENGISLCPRCHIRAEEWHNSGKVEKGFHPNELYALIGSSYDLAIRKAKEIQST
jgi:hypothetical protein